MGYRWGAAFVRIRWQASFGLGGSFAPDWVAGIIGIRNKEKESDHGGELQGGPFPQGYHPDGCALVCGVSLELSACRRTDGGARGIRRPRDHSALDREIQSTVGSGVSSPQAAVLGELADGRDVHQDQRAMVVPLPRGG